MGIRGLSSFIQQRSEKYLKDYKLQNSKVVVDGNNLLYFLFLSCPKQNPCFGGDYNSFGDHVRSVLRLFQTCNVDPIIIFDGGLDLNDRKAATRLSRAKQKLIASIKVKPSNQHRMSVLPLLVRTVFIDVIKEFKIEVIQCHHEADGDIAALARGLKCPVISNDSDFYVMGVLVIPLSMMELNTAVKSETGSAIQCKLFEMDAFLKSIGHQDSSIFPLLGTLLGNDYVNKDLFENIYSQIHVPKKKKSLMNDQHRRLQGLLEWLKGQTVEGAIDRILMAIKKIHHIEVEVAIRTSLNAYEEETHGELTSSTILKEKIIDALIEESLPEWFGKLYVENTFPPWILDVVICHKMPYQSQVENVHLSNSFSCCFNLLKAIALICWNSQSNNKLMTIWRKNTELAFKRMTVSQSNFTVQLPMLSSLESMRQLEKQKLFFDIVLDQNPGRLMEFTPKWQLVFASLVHWVRNSHCRVRSYHLDGLIVGLIHLTIVEPRIGKVRSLKRLDNIANSKEKDDPCMDFVKAARNTFKFQEVDPKMISHDVNYDRDAVHALAEFQATLYFATALSTLLGIELPYVSPSEFYCGTFINNAISIFKGYDRLVLAEKLYGGSDTFLFRTFQSYTELIYELAPSTLMDWVPHGPNKPRKRNKKRKNAKAKEVEKSSSDTDNVNEDEDDDLDLMSNRFNLLTVA